MVLKYAKAYVIIEEEGKMIKKENIRVKEKSIEIELKGLSMLMI